MNLVFNLYSLFFLAIAAVSFSVALLAWQRRLVKSARELAFLMMAAGLGAFWLIFETAASLQLVMESARKKRIEISFTISEDIKVYADENMLKSTIRNLTTNALKFTPKGGKISIVANSVNGNGVEISITDSGIGMNKDLLDKLFRLNEYTSRKGTDGESSTGLGLLLCKDFIEKHGGEIGAESEEGKGSVFHFNIPYHSTQD